MNSRIIKLVQAAPFLAAVYSEKNFTKAAQVLGVHQTAVSHRITAIEEMLNVKLMERTTRSLKFTQAGRWLCEASAKNVADIEAILQRIMQTRSDKTIRVTTPPSLAMKWLVPHLMKAREAGIDLSVQAQTHMVDFANGEADAGIRFGQGNYPGLSKLNLGKCIMQALASPAFIREHNIDVKNPWITKPDILVDFVSEIDSIDWGWQQYASYEPSFNASIASAQKFDRTDLALQGAISGLGIALGRSLLYEHDVENGFLVPVGPPHIASPSDWLVCSPEFARTDRYKTFAVWLQKQINETKAMMNSPLPPS